MRHVTGGRRGVNPSIPAILFFPAAHSRDWPATRGAEDEGNWERESILAMRETALDLDTPHGYTTHIRSRCSALARRAENAERASPAQGETAYAK